MSKKVKRISKISVGDIYPVKGGTLTVLERKSRWEILIKHNDEFGYEMWTRQDAIEKGMVKNPFYRSLQGVGYIGVGKYFASKDYKASKEYKAWQCMMHRGYNIEFKENHPTYKDCSVFEDWHNFQVFAEWYVNQEGYNRGFELDKDILVGGNKHYSPETCCLVPAKINCFFANQSSESKELPLGIYKNTSNTYSARISIEGKQARIGTYKKLGDAVAAYTRAKGIRCKELALIYREEISYKVFLAMMNKEF